MQATLTMEDRGYAAWVSGEYGFVTGDSVGTFLQIASLQTASFSAFSDVAFDSSAAYIPRDYGILEVVALDPPASEFVYAPPSIPRLTHIQALPDGRFAITISWEGEICDGVTAFTTFDPVTSGWSVFWGFDIE